jgi:PKHD-type hydroxylase
MSNKIPVFPYSPTIDISKHANVDDQFSQPEINELNDIINSLEYEEGRVVNDDFAGEVNKDVRKSNVKWIYPTNETMWLFTKLMKVIQSVNGQLWNFELIMAREPIQYTEYEDNGEYGWHIDTGHGPSAQRKVSVSVLLTNPDEYEGGDLELWPGGEIKRVERKQYTMTIFPSCILHRVTPVKKGVRKSLVFWVGGIPYR